MSLTTSERPLHDYVREVCERIFTQEHFHWQEDRPPTPPRSKMVIYETHVRGFMADRIKKRGSVFAVLTGNVCITTGSREP